MSEYDPQETDVSVQLLRQVHGDNPRLIDSLLRRTEPVLPRSMPGGSEKSIDTLFRNNKRACEHDKEGNPGVFNAISAPKPGTLKDRELDDDVIAMGMGPVKEDKKSKGKKANKKVPKASSTTLPAPQTASTIAPRRMSVRQQLQTMRYNTRSSSKASATPDKGEPQKKDKSIQKGKITQKSKATEKGETTKDTISNSEVDSDNSDSESSPSNSFSEPATRSDPIQPSSPPTQPAAAPSTPANRRAYTPTRPTISPLTPATQPAVAPEPSTPTPAANNNNPPYPPSRPRISPLTPPSPTSNTRATPAKLPDGTTHVSPPQDSPIHPPTGPTPADVSNDILDRALKSHPRWDVARQARKPAEVEYGGVAALVAGMKAAVARGDAFEDETREGMAGRDERQAEARAVEASARRGEAAARRFFEANPEAGSKEERRRRSAKMVETKRRKREEAEARRREMVELPPVSRGEATPKRATEPSAAETLAELARRSSAGVRVTRAQAKGYAKFLAEAGLADEDERGGGDAKGQQQQQEDETEHRKPAEVSSKRKRASTSTPLPRTPVRTRSKAAAQSSQLTPAMSGVAINADDSGYEGESIEIPLHDSPLMGPSRPASVPFGGFITKKWALDKNEAKTMSRRASLDSGDNSELNPVPLKRKVSFTNISGGERSAVKKTRTTPRKLQLTPASASKRRRTRDVSSSSDEATPVRKQRRRLVSMKELRLQEAAKSGSPSGSKAEQSTEHPESSHARYDSDQESELSNSMTDLALSDADDSAHEDSKEHSLASTAPDNCASEKPQKGEQAACPSTSVSEAPENLPSHDGTYRIDPALTFSERVQEILARNLGRRPSTYTGDSLALQHTNNPPPSSCSIPQHRGDTSTDTVAVDRAVTNIHNAAGHDDAADDAASPTTVFATTPPGEPRRRADTAGSGVDASEAAATEAPGVAVEHAGADSGEHGVTTVGEGARTSEPGVVTTGEDSHNTDEGIGEDWNNRDANSRSSNNVDGEYNPNEDYDEPEADFSTKALSSGPRGAVEAGPAANMGSPNTQKQQERRKQRAAIQDIRRKLRRDTEDDKIHILVKMIVKKEPEIKEERNSSEERTAQTPKIYKGKERQRDDVLAVEDEDGNELLLTPVNFTNFERERNRLAAAHTRDVDNVWTLGEELGVADLMNKGFMDPEVVMATYNEIRAGRRLGLLTLDGEAWITVKRRTLHEITAMMEQLKEDRDAQIAADYGVEYEMD